MNIACVIGNGPSRLNFDLNLIKSKMTTYGCNAIYRDFTPDYLISMDFNMVEEIIKSKAHFKSKFYTQHANRIDELARKGDPINFVLGQRETLDSGNTALRIALKNNYDIVYIIGFDYSKNPSSLPNVYLGTKNYPNSHVYPAASMQDTKWKQRINRLVREFTNTKIVRINGSNNPLNLTSDNFSEITIEQFKEILNA